MIRMLRGGLSCAVMASVLLASCGGRQREIASKYPSLCIIKESRVDSFLKRHGYSGSMHFELRRNSNGSALYITDLFGTALVTISSDGTVEHHVKPGGLAYLNDRGEFVAWWDDNDGGVRFATGDVCDVPRSGVDPGGEYFLWVGPKGAREIRATTNPTETLGKSRLPLEWIFARDGKVLAFARGRRKGPRPYTYEQYEIVCQRFRVDSDKVILEDEVHILRPSPGPSPFIVEDADCQADLVLLKDIHDPPFSFRTSWFIYDLKTKELVRVGRAKRFALFLSEPGLVDLLGRRGTT